MGRRSRVPLVWTVRFTCADIWARNSPVSSVSHRAPASSGSPPCRMTSTLDKWCAWTCSSMRLAVISVTALLISRGISRQP